MLRLAAREHVPEFVLKKRKRGFFNEAVGTWVGADGGALVDRVLLDSDPAYAAVIDRAAVEQTVREWRGGRAANANLLLGLVMLELWLGQLPAPGHGHRSRGARGVTSLTYAVVTPARNEEANLRRLGAALAAQTLAPAEWVVVDDGSTDATAGGARRAG